MSLSWLGTEGEEQATCKPIAVRGAGYKTVGRGCSFVTFSRGFMLRNVRSGAVHFSAISPWRAKRVEGQLVGLGASGVRHPWSPWWSWFAG